jgi:hypothetical protein
MTTLIARSNDPQLRESQRTSAVPPRDEIVQVSSVRSSNPTWWQAVRALFEAGIVALLFAVAILVVGSVVALAVRLFVEALTVTVRILLSIAA